MSDTTNVQLGHASVKFKDSELGHTQGGVTVAFEQNIVNAMVDAYGETPVLGVDNGTTVEVTVPLAEMTYQNLEYALPFSTVTSSPETLEIGGTVGGTTETKAGTLEVRPHNPDFSGFGLQVHKAMVTGVGDIAFQNSDQTIIEVTFTGYIDETATEGLLAVFKDLTA